MTVPKWHGRLGLGCMLEVRVGGGMGLGGPVRGAGTVVSSADAFFLHVERTGAAQHVGGVVVLEPSDLRPGIDEVRKLVASGFACLPRMHQRLARPSWWRRPRWIEAGYVDLDWHVVEHHSLNGWHGLLRYVGELAEQPMPRDRPLWRIAMVRNVGPGGTDALVVLLHHSIADGIGTILQAFSLFEPRPTMDIPVPAVPGRFAGAAGIAIGLAQLAAAGTTRPLPAGSLRREFAVAEVELDVVRRIAAAHGVRITDLLIALVADGLYAVSPALARSVNQQLRFSVTTTVRTRDSGFEGNATAATLVEIPVDGRPLGELLTEVAARTARRRRPTRAMASRFVMSTALRAAPEPFARWFAPAVYSPRFLHVVVSNMPGPTIGTTFAGVPHRRVYPILPLVPGTPLAVGALSWAGVLGIGLATDPRLVNGSALSGHVSQTIARLEAARPGLGALYDLGP